VKKSNGGLMKHLFKLAAFATILSMQAANILASGEINPWQAEPSTSHGPIKTLKIQSLSGPVHADFLVYSKHRKAHVQTSTSLEPSDSTEPVRIPEKITPSATDSSAPAEKVTKVDTFIEPARVSGTPSDKIMLVSLSRDQIRQESILKVDAERNTARLEDAQGRIRTLKSKTITRGQAVDMMQPETQNKRMK
jgi:hypothetical protein